MAWVGKTILQLPAGNGGMTASYKFRRLGLLQKAIHNSTIYFDFGREKSKFTLKKLILVLFE